MPTTRILEELLEHVQKCNTFSRSDCLRVFALSRQLAEANNKLILYPTLKFYADWSLHPKLDRTSARDLLKQIADAVIAHQHLDPKDFNLAIIETLSISNLHTDLKTILNEAHLPDFILNQPAPWSQCVYWLILDLLDKPVIGSEFTEEEKRTGIGDLSTPRVFRLIRNPDDEREVHWQITFGPLMHLKGKLLRVGE